MKMSCYKVTTQTLYCKPGEGKLDNNFLCNVCHHFSGHSQLEVRQQLDHNFRGKSANKKYDNLNFHSWDIADLSFQILWLRVGRHG